MKNDAPCECGAKATVREHCSACYDRKRRRGLLHPKPRVNPADHPARYNYTLAKQEPCRGCENEKICPVRKLACNDFIRYIEGHSTKGDRYASHGLYQRVYTKFDDPEIRPFE